MVALTGGLLISVFVFMMASQGSKFYQQEARVSNATIGVMNGFQRLRTDIARAGFLSSPNIVQDPVVCSGKSAAEGWTPAVKSLREMAGVRIVEGGSRLADDVTSELAGFWDANQLRPDELVLAGSFSSTDQFPAAEIAQPNPGGQPNVWRVYLQPNSPAMARLGYRTDGSQTDEQRLALVKAAFEPDTADRVLRILDKKGSHHYAVIDTVGFATPGGTGQQTPYIDLTDDVVLKQESRTTKCGLQGLNVGATVNVVNFIRYGLKQLTDAEEYPEFAAIYADEVEGTHEETRAELVREELDVAGAPIAGTTELVAEYGVDLRFSLSVLSGGKLIEVPEGDEDLVKYAGDPQLANGSARPDQIRSVHARLAVRSREGDRNADVDWEGAGLPEGLYRVSLGANGTAPFARVRTLQADIALRNHMRAAW
jgi:hypothetical protein